MKKMVLILTVALITAGACDAGELEHGGIIPTAQDLRSFQEKYKDASVNDLLQNDNGLNEKFYNPNKRSSKIEYHANKLKNFAYCAANKPSIFRVEQALAEARRGTATKEDLNIIAIHNFCDNHDNDWERMDYCRLFYHVRELGDTMGWSAEKIISEKAAFLSKLLTLQKEKCAPKQEQNLSTEDQVKIVPEKAELLQVSNT
jgi:hypothetical protein